MKTSHSRAVTTVAFLGILTLAGALPAESSTSQGDHDTAVNSSIAPKDTSVVTVSFQSDMGTPKAPAAAQSDSRVVMLPFRTSKRAVIFTNSAILRAICTRAYSAVVADDEVPCTESVQSVEAGDSKEYPESVRWLFRKAVEGAVQTLEVLVAPSPMSGYELFLMGQIHKKNGEAGPNPELSAIEENIEVLLDKLAAAPLDPSQDSYLSYQLSYVQADRAIAVLRTLGYTIVEYKYTSGSDVKPVVFDKFFEQTPALQSSLLARPLVIKMIDSEETSLVETALPQADPELAGGQPLNSIPDAAPQQRLLIVYEKSDRSSLDQLLAHLEREIDVPTKQILIEALVVELNTDRLLDLGIDFKGRKDNFDLSFEQQTGGLVQPFLFNFAQPAPRTLLELTAKLRALEDRGQATILSRPSVFVLDGRQARIKVGDNVPYTKKVVIGAGGVITSEIDFLKTGIILNLRPRSAADNSEVTMQVEAIISSPGASRVLPDIGALLAPTLQSRQIQTLVRVANDTPFVIGGLIAHNDQQSISGIPGLSRVPFLGALFRKKNATKDRREVIVVITPHIVSVDDTYAYTAPRDVGRAGAGKEASRARRSLPRRPSSCEPEVMFPVFDPAITQSRIEQGSVFDSLDADLFRSVYRLRSSDIFDLDFITRSSDVQQWAKRTKEIAGVVSRARFSSIPRIEMTHLKEEIIDRVRKNSGPVISEEDEIFAENFLTFFEGGVPGEDILVHHMMIRVIEKLGFGSCVSPDNMIYFPDRASFQQGQASGRLDPEMLTSSTCLRNCLEGETLVLAFPPKVDAEDDHLKDCLRQQDLRFILLEPAQAEDASSCKFSVETRKQDATNSTFFLPPVVRIACVPRTNSDGYLERLRRCNDISSGWQTILLDRDFKRRERNSIGLLQSVLALERLLEINDKRTFPRTLRDFHVGRELVMPTREDLRMRRHLIDRDTARKFYQTLDYYTAFAEMYKKLTDDFRSTVSQIEAATNKAKPAGEDGSPPEATPIKEPPPFP